ncbi:peptidoglycan-binding protein [Halobacillus litoralis]|uniref:peptidoglycan-binding protein n=1 Tax=Halobacillus litoralis TaxID=45668 RepID=UPI001CFD9C4E|nr:peptidoglycan-binding protein [Halobacillus litoralis]
MISVEILKERSRANIGAVRKDVKEKVEELIEQAYKKGIYVQISSGHRTLHEQAELYGQGRPDYYWNDKKYGKPGSIVTYAKPGQSNHHTGRAVDFFLVTPDGKTAVWTVDDQWRKVAGIAKSMGFSWGGDWRKFKDYAHLDFHPGISIWKEGSSGRGVEDIQMMLRDLGYSPGPIDGRFGPMTDKSVKTFQEKERLEADGIVGPITLKRLYDRTYPGIPFRIGSQGDQVKEIQKTAGAEVDGLYGKQTERFVRLYQDTYHLLVDGIVGPKTWRAMFGL